MAETQPFDEYMASLAASTTGISMAAGLNTAGSVVVAVGRTEFNVRDFGAVGDNATDDAASIQAAIDAAEANGGGVVYFPKTSSRYKVNSTLTVAADGVRLVGESRQVILDFAAQTSGPGVAIGGCFYYAIEDLAILNAYGDNVEINGGTVTGPHDYAAFGTLRNLYLRDARNGNDNLSIFEVIVSIFENIITHEASQHGIAVYGFATTLTFINCYPFFCTGDGAHIENCMGFSWVSTSGSDYNQGYAYYCEDSIGEFRTPYAEGNYFSMFHFFYDTATTALTPGIRVTIDTPMPFINNWDTSGGGSVRNAGVGHFATCSVTGVGSASSINAGTITLKNFKEQSSAVTGKHIEGAGAFQWDCDEVSLRRLTWATSIGFMVAGNGSTDVLYPLPVNITGANTRIATLGPKLRNGVGAFGGIITVTVSQNNRASASKFATYILALSRGTGLSELEVIKQLGHDGGAAADEPSFTFAFDSGTGELRATVVGSTGTGNWYFSLALQGNLSAIPG